MTPRDFFARVLVDEPSHVLTIGRTKDDGSTIFWNLNFETLDDAAIAASQHDNKGLTVYHALGTFADNESTRPDGKVKVERKAAQARLFRTLACDIDAGEGKPYPTGRDAAKALLTAVQAAPLPSPMLVSSGRGIHAYWPLDAAIDVSKWILASKGLRAVLLRHGVEIDESKICDPSMVLRPVGTFNRKDGARPVRLLQDAPDNPESFVLSMVTKAGTAPPRAKPGPGKRLSAVASALLDTSDLPPADPVQVATKCEQLRHVSATMGADTAEPLWYAVLGVAAFCVDPEQTAVQWSRGHPKFDQQQTLAKLSQWRANTTGATLCSRFSVLNPGPCKTCVHAGKIYSPVQLSIPKVVAVAGHKLPRGYRVNGDKIIRVVNDEVFPVCNMLLYMTDRFYDPEEEKMMCEVEAHLPVEGVKVVNLPTDVLASGGEKFAAHLMNHGISPGPNDLYIKNTRVYLMSYLEELQAIRKPIDTYSAFGWNAAGTDFVLGNRLYSHKGDERIRLAPTVTADMHDCYNARGSLAHWTDATALFGIGGLEYHAMAFLMGLGTPLLKFTKLDGMMCSMFSPESGTGKTTTGHFILSAWGDPKLIQIGRNDTLNALYRSLSLQNSLPAYCEEITNITPEDLSNLIYNTAHGRERRRLTEKVTMRTTGRWSLILFSSSNQSLVGKIQIGKMSSEGEAQRMLEYPFDPNSVFTRSSKRGTTIGRQIATVIGDNHGLAGPELLKAYFKAPDLHDLVSSGYDAVEREFGFTFEGPERYVQAAHTVAYLAAKIASRIGLIKFDYHRPFERSLQHVQDSRDSRDANRSDAFDILGAYVNESIDVTVIERHNVVSHARHHYTPLPRAEALIRFEIDQTNAAQFVGGYLFLSKTRFHQWCYKQGVDHGTVMRQLKGFGVTTREDRIALGRRTPLVTPAMRVYSIPLTHPRFSKVLDSTLDTADRAGLVLATKEVK